MFSGTRRFVCSKGSICHGSWTQDLPDAYLSCVQCVKRRRVLCSFNCIVFASLFLWCSSVLIFLINSYFLYTQISLLLLNTNLLVLLVACNLSFSFLYLSSFLISPFQYYCPLSISPRECVLQSFGLYWVRTISDERWSLGSVKSPTVNSMYKELGLEFWRTISRFELELSQTFRMDSIY
jgi:hypothetical protein